MNYTEGKLLHNVNCAANVKNNSSSDINTDTI